MRIERISIFQSLPKQEWRPVYLVLRGTQLCIYKIKKSTVASVSSNGPGRLIRRYTLQHAELGLATDVNDHVLVPQTRLAHMIPAIARRRAFEKDPTLFQCDKQYALRLRAETDQIVLADCKEAEIFDWMNAISAGMDISFEIDERVVPRQATVPRRQRHRRLVAIPQQIENFLQDRRLIAEQEEILRQMYPSLARSSEHSEHLPTITGLGNTDAVDFASNERSDVDRPVEDFAGASYADDLALTVTNINEQETDDIDVAAMAEEPEQLSTSRPGTSRQTTTSTYATAASSSLSNPRNFDEFGKWQPLHPQTARQQFRYIRRCMPILLPDTPRASSIVICNGARLHANNRLDMLEEWALAPPSYDAHKFPTTITGNHIHNPLERMPTQMSSAETASFGNSSTTADDGEIQVVMLQTSGDINLEAAAAGLKEMSIEGLKSYPLTQPPSPRSHAPNKMEEQFEHVRHVGSPHQLTAGF